MNDICSLFRYETAEAHDGTVSGEEPYPSTRHLLRTSGLGFGRSEAKGARRRASSMIGWPLRGSGMSLASSLRNRCMPVRLSHDVVIPAPPDKGIMRHQEVVNGRSQNCGQVRASDLQLLGSRGNEVLQRLLQEGARNRAALQLSSPGVPGGTLTGNVLRLAGARSGQAGQINAECGPRCDRRRGSISRRRWHRGRIRPTGRDQNRR